VLLAIIFGALGGAGLAFLLEYLEDIVNNPEEIERLTSWPILGNIPEFDPNLKITDLEKAMFVQTHLREPIAESYRTLRTNVSFSSTEEHPLKSMLITSCMPQEGKTITVCNLSIAMAQSQKRVLLIDADMRKPQLHGIFAKENEKGLSSFLSSQTGWKSLAQKTEIDNLFLITSGHNPPNPSELLASHKMKELVDAAKEEFDFIIFDSPPLALVTDATIISHAVDGVILVVESGKISRRVLLRISKLLKNAKIKVIGTLLNKISATMKSYYYYA